MFCETDTFTQRRDDAGQCKVAVTWGGKATCSSLQVPGDSKTAVWMVGQAGEA